MSAAREAYDQMLTRRTAALGVTTSDIEHLQLIYYADLGLCGCGYPDEAWKLVHQLLRLHDNRQRAATNVAQELIGTAGAIQIVFGVLDNAGLTEHGTSLWGGWLTDRGKWLLNVLNRLDGADLHDLWDELNLGLPHDGKDCPTGCPVPRKEA